MPQCICVTCFNMAVDFQVFLDAAMNNQKSFLDQIISYSKHSFVEEHKISPYSSTPNHMETIIVGNETLLKVKNINHKKLHNLTGNEIIRSNDNTVHKIKYNLQLTHKDHQHYRKKETVMKIKSNLQTGIQNFPNISTDKSTNTIENLSNSKSENDGTSKSAGIIENEDNLTSIDHHKAEKENSTKKSIACSQCNRMFHRPSELKSHILSHSNNRPHKCSMCSMSFKYQRNLKEHSSIHSENPEYICAICGMTFRQRSK
ncbi:unnamed protein product [Meganyctiphanes norvegica]|uniref:C2H2-type domain-containing protein n=2 Tax=Meganyctiphanes norvegica TaxID=48144 RepID=A0AAV2R440_MEGNR